MGDLLKSTYEGRFETEKPKRLTIKERREREAVAAETQRLLEQETALKSVKPSVCNRRTTMTIVLNIANVEVRDDKGELITTVPINVDSAHMLMHAVRSLGGQAEVVSIIDEVRDV